ncbi:MAG: hypothetical protein LR005_00805 [Candidatus Pacebacteria bacterium]|nr:hypothetical protein [Candidatus Paceibacterota bacterium]
MLNIFKYINYALKTKKGIHHTDELVTDVSFGPLEAIFIISFIILGFLVLGLGFLAFYYVSNIAFFFALMFFVALSIDIWIFIKVKKFFAKMSEKFVNYSKEKYKEFNSDNIVDVDYE